MSAALFPSMTVKPREVCKQQVRLSVTAQGRDSPRDTLWLMLAAPQLPLPQESRDRAARGRTVSISPAGRGLRVGGRAGSTPEAEPGAAPPRSLSTERRAARGGQAAPVSSQEHSHQPCGPVARGSEATAGPLRAGQELCAHSLHTPGTWDAHVLGTWNTIKC